MGEIDPLHDTTTRSGEYSRDANHRVVMVALTARRDEILARWAIATGAQTFHNGRAEPDLQDHMPALVDALFALLNRSMANTVETVAPLDDEAFLEAARGHSVMRADQGLQPVEILAEFRVMRQELWRALRLAVPDSVAVSDLVAAELVLNDAIDAASALALTALTERVETVREEFLATVVHELRQPLTKVNLYTQVLERREGASATTEGIRRALQHANVLLSTLVDASRTALGGLVLQFERADMAALIVEAMDRLDPETAARVRLVRPEAGECIGRWDRVRMVQVLLNLLSNAGKYSPADAPIEVEVGCEGETAHVRVTDSGIGIRPEDLPLLFGRYARAANALESRADGLGLGLYLCRGIVEAHGGRIWADSAGEGLGATLRFDLPLTGERAQG